jgi:Terminase RNaseH-like domain
MPEISTSRYIVQAGWNDVPHLDEVTKGELLESTPPHLRDARSKGEPSMGSGAIYPIPIADVEVRPFAIPFGWKKAYALDVGWNRTAALWGAQNPVDGIIYLYSEHYKGQQLPVVHAAAIKTRGEWIRGAIDPAAGGASQRDGAQLKVEYRSLGLNLVDANNDLESGLIALWQALSLGRLKVFSTLQNWKAEYRVYQRDERGRVKDGQADHLMDAMRYLFRTWDKVATLPPLNDDRHGGGLASADRRAGY